MDLALSKVCFKASTVLMSGLGVPLRTAAPICERTKSTRLPLMTLPFFTKASKPPSDKMTKSNFSPREKRVGIESGALPTEAPNALITLWPVCFSNSGTSFL